MRMESPGVVKTFLSYIVVMVAHCECTMPLNYILKMVKMLYFILHIFSDKMSLEHLTVPETKDAKEQGRVKGTQEPS